MAGKGGTQQDYLSDTQREKIIEGGGQQSKFGNWSFATPSLPFGQQYWNETHFGARHFQGLGIETYTVDEINRVFRKYDLNHDGMLERNEVRASPPSAFNHLLLLSCLRTTKV
eukprot:9491568-Pyramimonas_sp.AAC.1